MRHKGAWLGLEEPPCSLGPRAGGTEQDVSTVLPLPITIQEQTGLAGLDVPKRLRGGHVQNDDIDGVHVDGKELGGKVP